jgi:CBS domain-containing protein
MISQGPDAYVAGAMDRNPLRLPPDMDLSEAFAKASGAPALVMDGDNLLGLLTAENLSEFLLLRQISLIPAKGQTSS